MAVSKMWGWIALAVVVVTAVSLGVVFGLPASDDATPADTPAAAAAGESVDEVAGASTVAPTQTVVTFVGGEDAVRVMQVKGPSELPALRAGESATVTYTIVGDRPEAVTVVPISSDDNVRFTPQAVVWTADTAEDVEVQVSVSEGTSIRRGRIDYGTTITSRWEMSDMSSTSFAVVADVTAPQAYVDMLPGETSGTHTCSVAEPPLSDVTVTPVSEGLVFEPASLTWEAGDGDSKTFTVRPRVTGAAVGTNTITYEVSGEDADLFVRPAAASLVCTARPVAGPAVPSAVQVGTVVGDIEVTLPVLPETEVTLTVAASDFVFTPATLTWTPGDALTKTFSVRPRGVAAAVGARDLVYALGGASAGAYGTLVLDAIAGVPVAISAPASLPVTDAGATTASLEWSTPLAPEEGEVTLTPSATGLTFTPSTLTWGVGDNTVQTATITTDAGLAPDAEIAITYTLGGSAKDAYTAPAGQTFHITGNSPEPASAYTQVLTDLLGGAVHTTVLSGDARFAVGKGGLYTDQYGRQAHRMTIFRNDVGTWTPIVEPQVPELYANSTLNYLYRFALNHDGSYMMLNAMHKSGSYYYAVSLFKRNDEDGTSWTHVSHYVHTYGSSVQRISLGGRSAAIMQKTGSPAGITVFYIDDNDALQVVETPTGNSSYNISGDVSLSADGDVLAVGRPNTGTHGEVGIYTRSGLTWTLSDTITSAYVSSPYDDGFGMSVRLDATGGKAAILHPMLSGEHRGASPYIHGRVELWDKSSGSWVLANTVDGYCATEVLRNVPMEVSDDHSRVFTVYGGWSATEEGETFDLAVREGTPQTGYAVYAGAEFDGLNNMSDWSLSASGGTLARVDTIVYVPPPAAPSRQPSATSERADEAQRARRVWLYVVASLGAVALLVALYAFARRHRK